MTAVELEEKSVRFWKDHYIEVKEQHFTVMEIDENYDLTHELIGSNQIDFSKGSFKWNDHHKAEVKLPEKDDEEDGISLLSYLVVVLALILLAVYFMRKRKAEKEDTYRKNKFSMIEFHEEENPEFPHLEDND